MPSPADILLWQGKMDLHTERVRTYMMTHCVKAGRSENGMAERRKAGDPMNGLRL